MIMTNNGTAVKTNGGGRTKIAPAINKDFYKPPKQEIIDICLNCPHPECIGDKCKKIAEYEKGAKLAEKESKAAAKKAKKKIKTAKERKNDDCAV